MATPTIPNGEEYFFPIIYEGNGGGQRVGRFVPFTDNGTIDNSCLFENNVSSYLQRTLSSNGSGTTLTFSCWVKRDILTQGLIGSLIMMHSDVSANGEVLTFDASDRLYYYEVTSGSRKWEYISNRTFEDTSKWYHIYVRRDTTDSTAADRIQIYVDGERITSWNTETQPALNATGYWNQTTLAATVGNTFSASYKDGAGYLAEVNMIDGSNPDVSTFGLTDTSTGRWIPKTLSGITYGTNGFRLKFQDSSALGDDTSGNGNDFSATNLSASNQTTDSPTQNHCTWDPNDHANLATFSEGNLKVTGGSAGTSGSCRGTLAPKSGKYYFEVKFLGGAFAGHNSLGIRNKNVAINSTTSGSGVTTESYHWRDDGYAINGTLGQMNSGFSSYTTNDYIGVAMDLDTGKIWMSKNGTYEKSGNPVTGENPMFIVPTGQPYAPWWLGYGYTNNNELNCGQKAFNTDPPTGFLALQQDNLPTTDRGVSGLTWTKNRDGTDWHYLVDSSRGNTKALNPNDTAAEETHQDGVQKFLKGGISVEDRDNVNKSGNSFVNWTWVANGGTTETNTDGSITSTVQKNTTSGFSIVEFTTPASTQDFTVGHGLGVIPRVFFFKRLDSTSGWAFYHQDVFDTYGNQYTLFLNTSGASYAPNPGTAMYPSATTATTFSLRAGASIASSANCVAYCFNEVEGFSKFGKYAANNSADGPFVYLGFKPKFLIIKSNGAISWYIMDATRNTFNPVINGNTIDNPQVEFTVQFKVDFLSNGFKIRNDSSVYGASTNNTSYSPYYYMAFAEHPFVGDGTSPVTAR